MLATGLMVGYGYVMETFTGWYSGDIFEQYLVINRAIGPYGWTYWLLLTVNIVIPQLLWIRRIRSNPISLFAVSLSINDRRNSLPGGIRDTAEWIGSDG
jgi:hypothetical protein